MAQQYPYEEWDPILLRDQTTIQIVVTAVIFVICIFLWQRFTEKRKDEIKLLAISITAMDFAFLVATIPMIMVVVGNHDDIINGLPVFFGTGHVWWTNLSYIFVSITSMCMLRFIQLLFKKPSNRAINFMLFANIGINLWSLYHATFVVVPGIPSLTLPMSIIWLLLCVYTWGILFAYSYHDYKKIEPSIFRVGLGLISVSALCMIISYALYAVYSVFKMQQLGKIYYIFYIITALLIYIGYILPNWLRKILLKKYPNST